MLCPRRSELPPRSYWPDQDEYESRLDQEGTHCSFCGSRNPEEFMAAVRDGAEVGPTDKSYKVYLQPHGKFYFQHLSQEQADEFIALLNAKRINIGFPGRFYVLPYFIAVAAPKGS